MSGLPVPGGDHAWGPHSELKDLGGEVPAVVAAAGRWKPEAGVGGVNCSFGDGSGEAEVLSPRARSPPRRG